MAEAWSEEAQQGMVVSQRSSLMRNEASGRSFRIKKKIHPKIAGGPTNLEEICMEHRAISVGDIMLRLNHSLQPHPSSIR